MVFEHAESTRYLDMMKILFRKDGFEDTLIIRTDTELKFDINPWKMKDLTHGLSFPEEWTSMWKNFTEKRKNLFTSKRWLPAWRNPLRQNTRDNQVHHHIPSPRCSFQLTNGNGMIFLPSTTSVKDPCHTESQRLWLRYYDIVVLIERMMERLMEYIVTQVMSRLDESGMAGSFSKRKWQEMISVLPELRRSHSPSACHPRSLRRSQGWSYIAG